MVIGIINISLTAKYFGVSFGKDLWILALTLALFLDAIIWGPINETFRAKFIFLKGEYGEYEALNKTKSLLFYTVLVSSAVVGVLIIYPNILAKIVAPTYQGNQLEELLKMVKFIAPVLLINQITAIGISILNAYESFFIPEISGFISSIINLVLIIFLAPLIGIYSLLVAYYLGIIVLMAMIIFQLYKLKIDIFKGYNNVNSSDFFVFFLFALPFFFPYFFGQISSLLEKTLASSLGVGNISVLDYSRRFTDILISTLSSVLITMLVPVLSKNFIEKKIEDFVFNFMQLYQLGLLFITFVIAIFTVCSRSFVDLFYDKGLISDEILSTIASLTMYYSWSTLAVFIYTIFGLVLLSAGLGKKYAFFGVIAQSLSIILNLALFKIVGIYIFPISFFISHLFAGVIMFFHFPYKLKSLYWVTLKYFSVLLVTSIVLIVINRYFFQFSNSFINITFNSVLILSIIVLLVFLFNLEEKKQIKFHLKKVFKYV